MIEYMDFVRIEKNASFLVANECVILPAIPETCNDVVKFFRPTVSFVMLHLEFYPEISGCIGVRGCNNVPARTSSADVIKRGKPACDMIRGIISCR